MTHCTQPVLLALLALVGGFLISYIAIYDLPEVLRAGIMFTLIMGLVGVLLAHDAEITVLRCICAVLLCGFVAGPI